MANAPLKIAFNARLLSDGALRGWNRYLLNLLRELAGLDVRLWLYSDAAIHPDNIARLPAGSFEQVVAPPMKYFTWEQRWLRRQAGIDGVDVLHSPYSFGLPRRAPCPTVLTLHDAIQAVPEFRGPRRWVPRVGEVLVGLSHLIARRRATRIITVSEHARVDIAARLGVKAARLTVISEDADPRFRAPVGDADVARVRAAHGLSRPYVFYIGGWEKRKNVPFLLDAFARAELAGVELVLAGGKDGEMGEMRARLAEMKLAERVRLLGKVDDADLPALYAGATCFVYPSRYEGFGLQLCEAMAVGCPCLAADATSLPEVLGDGGELFTLTDPAQLVGQLRRVTTDPAHRATLSARAAARAAAFSWRRTAEETVEVYRELMAGR